MAAAEEELIGWLSKASGIATAARRARRTAGKDLKVVSGAWKKMPLPLRSWSAGHHRRRIQYIQ